MESFLVSNSGSHLTAPPLSLSQKCQSTCVLLADTHSMDEREGLRLLGLLPASDLSPQSSLFPFPIQSVFLSLYTRGPQKSKCTCQISKSATADILMVGGRRGNSLFFIVVNCVSWFTQIISRNWNNGAGPWISAGLVSLLSLVTSFQTLPWLSPQRGKLWLIINSLPVDSDLDQTVSNQFVIICWRIPVSRIGSTPREDTQCQTFSFISTLKGKPWSNVSKHTSLGAPGWLGWGSMQLFVLGL